MDQSCIIVYITLFLIAILIRIVEVPISPRHPAWIGAWWLGFLVFGLISMLIGFPLLCFPRRMKPKPIAEKVTKTDGNGAYKKSSFGKSTNV